jgi:hypothetical protein
MSEVGVEQFCLGRQADLVLFSLLRWHGNTEGAGALQENINETFGVLPVHYGLAT